MGKLSCGLGLLPSDTVVEKSASELQTGYVGQAGLRLRATLKEARGGVLFIDEAYQLISRPGGGDFNTELVGELVKAMPDEERKGRIAIIWAGYERHINLLMEAHPGLPRRFPNVWKLLQSRRRRCCGGG